VPNGDEDASSPPLSAWDRLADLPDLEEAPLDAPWLASRAPAETPPRPTDDQAPPRDQRQFRVTADPGGVADIDTHSPEPGGLAPAPEQQSALPPPRAQPRRSRRRLLIALLVAVPLLAVLGFGFYAWVLWGRVEKIDTAGTLSAQSPGFENYLIVGVDSREGVDPDLETADSIGLRVAGSRSDTMVLLHVGEPADRMISLPRDLWVDIPGHGASKLNAASALGGPPALIESVKGALDAPVHHYLEVDIAGFLSVIDAVGTITIEFGSPACDPKSGLDVRQTGLVALDSEQALAYVRSRTYTEFDAADAAGLDCAEIRAAGLGVTRGNADFGRTERQRRFLLAVFDTVSSTRNPVTVLSVLSGLSDGLRVDDTMGVRDAFGLLQELRGLDADTSPLPVVDFAAPNGSAALALAPGAEEVLDSVR